MDESRKESSAYSILSGAVRRLDSCPQGEALDDLIDRSVRGEDRLVKNEILDITLPEAARFVLGGEAGEVRVCPRFDPAKRDMRIEGAVVGRKAKFAKIAFDGLLEQGEDFGALRVEAAPEDARALGCREKSHPARLDLEGE